MTPERLAVLRVEIDRRREVGRMCFPRDPNPTVLVPDGVVVEMLAEIDRARAEVARLRRRIWPNGEGGG